MSARLRPVAASLSPLLRSPSAHELLSDPFIKRGMKTSKLPEALLDDIPEVGSKEAMRLDTEGKPKGYGPLDLKALVGPGGAEFRGPYRVRVGAGSQDCAPVPGTDGRVVMSE